MQQQKQIKYNIVKIVKLNQTKIYDVPDNCNFPLSAYQPHYQLYFSISWNQD